MYNLVSHESQVLYIVEPALAFLRQFLHQEKENTIYAAVSVSENAIELLTSCRETAPFEPPNGRTCGV